MGAEDSFTHQLRIIDDPPPTPLVFEVRVPDHMKGYLCLTKILETLSSQLNEQHLSATQTSWHRTGITSSRDAHADKDSENFPCLLSSSGTPSATKGKLWKGS